MTQDIVLHARKWPVILLMLGNVFQAAYIVFAVHSLSDLPERVHAVERYLEADRARHATQDAGIQRYYNVTLPKLEKDTADLKAEVAAVRAELRGLRDLIGEIRKDLRARP